jgi:toxin ParE1/3/4
VTAYVLSRRARRDLQDIWRFSAERWNPEKADEYVAAIVAAVAQFANGQGASQTVEFHGRPYARIFARSHAVFCRRSGSRRLEVVRILHQSMDFNRHLKRR